MAARLDSVARYICSNADWSLSNLQLQKLMYLAQMIHMGRYKGYPLFDGQFQAWDYGPVEPSLYHRAKVFGSDPVSNIFYNARSFDDEDYRRTVMDDVVDRFASLSGGDLVDLTHWDGGAWASRYVPRARNIVIPNADILAEYQARQNVN